MVQEFSGRKVDLMQPLSTFFNTNNNSSVKDKRNSTAKNNTGSDYNNSHNNTKMGKSRNGNDQCY